MVLLSTKLDCMFFDFCKFCINKKVQNEKVQQAQKTRDYTLFIGCLFTFCTCEKIKIFGFIWHDAKLNVLSFRTWCPSRLGLSRYLLIQSIIFDAIFCRRELRRFCFRSYKNIQNSQNFQFEVFKSNFSPSSQQGRDLIWT